MIMSPPLCDTLTSVRAEDVDSIGNSAIFVNTTTLPEECQFLLAEERTNFNATVVVTVSADVLCATQEELFLLEKTLAEAYNQLNVFNPSLCDPFSRIITDVKVFSDLGTLTVVDPEAVEEFEDSDRRTSLSSK